jgi:hypothetical protein
MAEIDLEDLEAFMKAHPMSPEMVLDITLESLDDSGFRPEQQLQFQEQLMALEQKWLHEGTYLDRNPRSLMVRHLELDALLYARGYRKLDEHAGH